MIVNTMIGKSGGGGDVTVQATELTIDDSNVVHLKFPGLPAGATIKNLYFVVGSGSQSWTVYDSSGTSKAGGKMTSVCRPRKMTSGNFNFEYYIYFTSTNNSYFAPQSATSRFAISVADGEITFKKPTYTPKLDSGLTDDGYSATLDWTVELDSSRNAYITYST